jgi:hypothetical protein
MAPAAETRDVGQTTDSTATSRMGVTQQLVRLSEPEIRRCATDVLAMEELVSFELAAATDTLDLDWASAGLERLASAYAVEVASAMRILLDGAALVSSEYPEGPPGIGYTPRSSGRRPRRSPPRPERWYESIRITLFGRFIDLANLGAIRSGQPRGRLSRRRLAQRLS